MRSFLGDLVTFFTVCINCNDHCRSLLLELNDWLEVLYSLTAPFRISRKLQLSAIIPPDCARATGPAWARFWTIAREGDTVVVALDGLGRSLAGIARTVEGSVGVWGHVAVAA
jgi:hypothetical protein